MKTDTLIKVILTISVGVALILLVRYAVDRVGKKSDKIHRRFLARLLNLIVIITCLVNIIGFLEPSMNLHSVFLKGSALVVAIVGFAAQPAISDLICGFLISINKPFEIGDRIIVEGMEPGIVEDITLRHTVIRIYDGLKVIVPNSELNSKTVTNTTNGADRRGIHLQYSVSYDTDVQLAMDVIRDCVVESPYTLSVETNGIKEDSSPVYFLRFAESALILETTIWISSGSNSYIAVTDVNMRVNKAFKERGIEIPYNFVNVVEREYVENGDDGINVKKKKTSPSKRSVRTDTISVTMEAGHIDKAMETVRGFAKRQRFTKKSSLQLELMTEELIGILGNIVERTKASFWVEGSGQKYRIHLKFPTNLGAEEYKKLVALSTSGKNEAIQTLSGKIWEKIASGIKSTEGNREKDDYEWSYSEDAGPEDDISESILAAVADDIKVSVTKENVHLVVVKAADS
ncbi:MAG: mechanosensitive ion channel family protein [Lachnospiraceae bacterium]|nr:mechanosensitive ion channel family protein [Lachnospiraceae bacterium]